MLEIKKATVYSWSNLTGLNTLLKHCSGSVGVNYYTRLHCK